MYLQPKKVPTTPTTTTATTTTTTTTTTTEDAFGTGTEAANDIFGDDNKYAENANLNHDGGNGEDFF